jgi:tetratricopeptide (TPR) repeat protein
MHLLLRRFTGPFIRARDLALAANDEFEFGEELIAWLIIEALSAMATSANWPTCRCPSRSVAIRAPTIARWLASRWRRWSSGAQESSGGRFCKIIWLLLERTLQRHNLLIDPIAVPGRLAEDGFTTDVVTQRLRDAIKELQDRTPTKVAKYRIDLSESIPDINIPRVSVTVGGVASWLHRLVPEDWQHEISGDFVLSGSGLSVHLRLNGEVVFSEATIVSDGVDRLIEKGALKVLQATQPSVAAGYFFATGDSTSAATLVDQIIASLPPDDENVKQAHNLKGLIAQRYDRLDEASSEYRHAIQLDPRFAPPHTNLGNVLRQQGKMDEAIAEYRLATQLDPKSAAVHTNLGNAFEEQGKPNEAISEYRLAIQLDPKLALPHTNLGNALQEQGKPDEAISEHRLAIEFDPKLRLQIPKISGFKKLVGVDEVQRRVRAEPQPLAHEFLVALWNPFQPRHCPSAAGQAGRGDQRISARRPVRPEIRSAALQPR